MEGPILKEGEFLVTAEVSPEATREWMELTKRAVAVRIEQTQLTAEAELENPELGALVGHPLMSGVYEALPRVKNVELRERFLRIDREDDEVKARMKLWWVEREREYTPSLKVCMTPSSWKNAQGELKLALVVHDKLEAEMLGRLKAGLEPWDETYMAKMKKDAAPRLGGIMRLDAESMPEELRNILKRLMGDADAS